jgi:hypothetical protein
VFLLDDENFLRKAFEVAKQALDHGNHPFGSILVDPNGEILLESENGCHSACNIGSDSFLMKFAGRLWFSNGESAPCGRAFKSHR